MSFRFVSDNGRSKIVVDEGIDHVFPLEIAPSSMEDMISKDSWIIVCMSVWNADHIAAGICSVETIARYNGRVNLGLRPFDFPQENATWIPGFTLGSDFENIEVESISSGNHLAITIHDTANSGPIWVALVEGKLVDIKLGDLSRAEVESLIDKVLSAKH